MKSTTKIIIALILMIILSVVFLSLVLNERKQIDDNITEKENTEKENLIDIEFDKNNEVENMNNVVIMETSKGNIEIELYPEKAPITVENFLKYVDNNFYSGLVFHRVISGFMIQGGGFNPDGTQKKTLPPIKLESNKGLSNLTGTIAMARTNNPDSATGQFFINTVDNLGLDYSPRDPGYAVFGKVISGMDVVYEIEKSKTTTKGYYQDWPIDDIVILKVYRK